MPNKPLSRNELVERLKAIANEDVPKMGRLIALCYEMSSPFTTKRAVCDVCRSEILYSEWDTASEVVKVVRKIRNLGYDAKVEVICKKCAEEIKMELNPLAKSIDDKEWDMFKDFWIRDLNFLFYFRLSEQEDYHRVIVSMYSDFGALLALLENKPLFTDSRNKVYYLADEIDVIEFMTGLKLNE